MILCDACGRFLEVDTHPIQVTHQHDQVRQAKELLVCKACRRRFEAKLSSLIDEFRVSLNKARNTNSVPEVIDDAP